MKMRELLNLLEEIESSDGIRRFDPEDPELERIIEQLNKKYEAQIDTNIEFTYNGTFINVEMVWLDYEHLIVAPAEPMVGIEGPYIEQGFDIIAAYATVPDEEGNIVEEWLIEDNKKIFDIIEDSKDMDKVYSAVLQGDPGMFGSGYDWIDKWYEL